VAAREFPIAMVRHLFVDEGHWGENYGAPSWYGISGKLAHFFRRLSINRTPAAVSHF